MRKRTRVVVAGAGFAGITAAFYLAKAGMEVILLEKEGRAGGCAFSTPVLGNPNLVEDRGGQFILLPHYRYVEPLIYAGGIAHELVEIGQKTATYRDGKFRGVDYRRPSTIQSSGLLSPRASREVLDGYARMARRVEGLPPDRYTAWYAFDTPSLLHTALWWFETNYGEEGTAYLVDPLFNGLFFHSLQFASKTQAAWLVANLDRGDRWYVMERGAQSIINGVLPLLPDVRLKTPIESMSATEDGKAIVRTEHDEIVADAVVVAVPPPVAVPLITNPLDWQAEFLHRSRYWSTIVVNLHLNERLSDSAFRGVHMAMIPAKERMRTYGGVAAFSVESGKRKRWLGDGEILGTHMMSEAAERVMHEPDETIVQIVLRELQYFLPDLNRKIHHAVVTRWPYAIPKTPPGRVTEIANLRAKQEYQSGKEIPNPFLFASAATSFPTFAGAAESGYYSANLLIRRFQR